MEHTFVDREIARGVINGSDYGASVPIIARSPTHIIFHARGARIVRRNDTGFMGMTYITSDRPSRAAYENPHAQSKIDAVFGEGAHRIVLDAVYNKKTALINGGGEALPPPINIVRKKIETAYQAFTINWTADLTGRIKTCRQCAGNLSPVYTHFHFDYDYDKHPTNLDDCQRMTNHEVVLIRDFGSINPEMAGKVNYFFTWDGESVVDPYFCSKECAILYAYRAAQEFAPLPVNEQPAPYLMKQGDIKSHRNPQPTIVTSDGKEYKT